ncbi:hypothetical protein [Tepidanaerobacter sp. EBM-38]|jgi:hypothetical protein|uniref:hypothetical protein n=1 Tax=Tepidanaerobacter sp. EBM-38 TaxID=1918496 RepID=UPI000AB6F0E2|nr:hypothetical protein [Tepidanaerobacter sp. EBM-38]
MSLSRSASNNNSGKDTSNPMKQVQTTQIPTKEQRDDGYKRPILGGKKHGK